MSTTKQQDEAKTLQESRETRDSATAQDKEAKAAKSAKSDKPAEGHNVTVTSTGFDPAQITIRPGDTVSWKNEDNTGQHSVKFDAPKEGLATPAGSGSMLHGKGCAVEFPQAGTFEYGCEHNPNMRGVVIVTSG